MNYDNNRANQQNPNHLPTGPGRPRGYRGTGDKADLENHGNQLNPMRKEYYQSRGIPMPAVQAGNSSRQVAEEEEESGMSTFGAIATTAAVGVGLIGLYTLFRSSQSPRNN